MHPSCLGVTAPFFLYQVLGIAFEDAVGARGYVWVATWLLLTAPTFIDALVRLGIVRVAVIPTSVSPCTIAVEYLKRRTGTDVSSLFPPMRFMNKA